MRTIKQSFVEFPVQIYATHTQIHTYTICRLIHVIYMQRGTIVKNGPKTNRADKLTKQIAGEEVASRTVKYHSIPGRMLRCEHFASIKNTYLVYASYSIHANQKCTIHFFLPLLIRRCVNIDFLFDSNSNNRRKQTALTYALI